jgi:hypothetical protein
MSFAIGFANRDIFRKAEAECLGQEWIEGEVEAWIARTIRIDGLPCSRMDVCGHGKIQGWLGGLKCRKVECFCFRADEQVGRTSEA